ncbi:MAG: sulfur oxidation c-type cytochrome SoxX [Salinisphaera sp.]|nr:sulfur oxidation c-type cytochrome SoxX [Salinisphaera sp.]
MSFLASVAGNKGCCDVVAKNKRNAVRGLRKFEAVAAGLLVVAASLGLAPACAQPQSGASKSDLQTGRDLAFARKDGNCLACHHIAGGEMTGNVGPALVNMKSRYPDREVLFRRIWDETQFNPMTIMPPFGRNGILTKQEIHKIIDFLYTL